MLRLLLTSLIAFATVASAADMSILRLLPPGAAFVIGIDVEAGKNSPFGRYLLAQTRADSLEFQDFIDLTGFDPRRDLREIYFASPRPVPGSSSNDAPLRSGGLFIAKGTFNHARILDATRLKGGQSLVYQGIPVVAYNRPKEDAWIALVDPGTTIGGSPGEVRAAIARRAQNQNTGPVDEIRRLASRYDAWLFTVTPTANLHSLPNNSNGQMLRSIERLTAGVRFGSKVELESQAIARSEKDATALQDVIRFVAGMIQINREDNPASPVATLLESLEVKVSGLAVNVSLAIPEVDLERLLESGPKRSGNIARAQ